MTSDVEWEPILRAIAAKLHAKADLIGAAVIDPELLIKRCPLCEGPCDEDCPLALVRKEILDAAYFTAAANADRPSLMGRWISVPDKGDRLSLLRWIAANDGREVTRRLYRTRAFKRFVRWLRRHSRR